MRGKEIGKQDDQSNMVVLQKPPALGPTEKHTEYMKIKPLPPMELIPEYILAPRTGFGGQRGKRRAPGTRQQAAENRISKRRRQNKLANASRRVNRK